MLRITIAAEWYCRTAFFIYTCFPKLFFGGLIIYVCTCIDLIYIKGWYMCSLYFSCNPDLGWAILYSILQALCYSNID